MLNSGLARPPRLTPDLSTVFDNLIVVGAVHFSTVEACLSNDFFASSVTRRQPRVSFPKFQQLVVLSFQLLLCYHDLHGKGFELLTSIPSWHLSC